jgi:hypothetical protein
MSAKLTLKLLGGAVALALAGTASAVTSAAGGTTGTVFLNVVDVTNNTSFFFDTGKTQATFDPNANFSANLGGDANYQAFVAGQANGDLLDFSVISGTTSGLNRNVWFTGLAQPVPVVGSQIAQAEAAVEAITSAVNQVTPNASTVSAYVNLGSTAAAGWATSGDETALNGKLKVADASALGTAIDFFSEITNASNSTLTKGTVSKFAGQWNFTQAGLLTYSVGTSPIPLPAPVLLLLSGLGLMGVIGRRGKSASGDSMFNGAAA